MTEFRTFYEFINITVKAQPVMVVIDDDAA
jgi:hypothetical protein